MFYNCTSLTQAPELLATTLDNTFGENTLGYSGIFENCTSLKYASFPNLDKETVTNMADVAFYGAANNIEVTCKDGILIINSTEV